MMKRDRDINLIKFIFSGCSKRSKTLRDLLENSSGETVRDKTKPREIQGIAGNPREHRISRDPPLFKGLADDPTCFKQR